MHFLFIIVTTGCICLQAQQEGKFRGTAGKEALLSGSFHPVTPGGWNYNPYSPATCKGTPEDKCGPAYWTNVQLPGVNNMCGGVKQTPIDVPLSAPIDPALKFPTLKLTDGGCLVYTSFVDQKAFEVSFTEPGYSCANQKLMYQGTEYTLLQWHTHTESEHKIRGQLDDAELHLVHISATGKLLVLGIFLQMVEDGTVNGPLNEIFIAAAQQSQGAAYKGVITNLDVAYEWHVTRTTPLNAYSMIPASKTYYTYDGSLTTWPCTEGVKWLVFDEPVKISKKQLSLLRGAVSLHPDTIVFGYSVDNRPVQPLNGRVVTKYVEGVVAKPSVSPVKKPSTPVKTPVAPVKTTVAPVKKPSATPVKKPSTPVKTTVAPVKKPSTTPVKKPSTPVKTTVAPVKKPSTAPVKKPSAPVSGKFHQVTPGGWNYNPYSPATCKGTPEDKCGPAYWTNVQLPGVNNMCGGMMQTPIDVPLSAPADSTLKFPTLKLTDGGCLVYTSFVDQKAFEVSFNEPGYSCTNQKLMYQGTEYTLLQWHTHTESEHKIRGQLDDAELHLVHVSATGKLLVLGIFLQMVEDGTVNGPLNEIFIAAAQQSQGAAYKGVITNLDVAYEWHVTRTTPLNAYSMIPASKTYYTYDGSLTTWPCTEGVKWLVFDEPVKISKKQLSLLRGAVSLHPDTIVFGYSIDNRPVQPLNGRVVKKYIG